MKLHFTMLGVAVVVFAAPAMAADGKAIYTKTCAVCHATGVANAPKLSDKAAWGLRAKLGQDALVASVVKGKGVMPPKAGSPNLSEADIKAAVGYMLTQAK